VSDIEALIGRMRGLLQPLEARGDGRRFFLATYLRTTLAVAERIERGEFDDPPWVERWDVAFANLYLDALEAWESSGRTPDPWTVAFTAARDQRLPPLRHLLLGMNAHINYDLPQALLEVISDDQFDDPECVRRRRADHERIDQILAGRVAAEDAELARVEQPDQRSLLDRLLVPFNQAGTRRFLAEARRKVWRNAVLLSQARRDGAPRLQARLDELEALCAQRVSDLRAPGQVILRLTRKGFGVELSDPAGV
jgi:Family of unknown function (DUF5995)